MYSPPLKTCTVSYVEFNREADLDDCGSDKGCALIKVHVPKTQYSHREVWLAFTHLQADYPEDGDYYMYIRRSQLDQVKRMIDYCSDGKMDAQTYNIWVENAADFLCMYNCILAGGDNIGLAFENRDVSNYKGDYNLFHNDDVDRVIVVGYTDEFSLDQIDTWTAYSGQDAHSLVAYSVTEIFIDPISFDLHLLETSPAVDNGTSAGAPSEDYDGNPRPQGEGYDIGAYER